MAVQVAAGAVVVLGRARVGMPASIRASGNGTPASNALVMAACRKECGLMCRESPRSDGVLRRAFGKVRQLLGDSPSRRCRTFWSDARREGARQFRACSETAKRVLLPAARGMAATTRSR